MRWLEKAFSPAITVLVLMIGTPARSAPPLCTLAPTLSADGIPDDVCNAPHGLPEFANMAWQTFKMLVWPAAAGPRGEADATRGLTDMTGPRVFETYKGVAETFLTAAAEPPDWDLYLSTAAACSNQPPIEIAPGTLVLASFNEFGNVLEAGFGNFTHVLVAQNGKLVRYHTGFNESQFKLIRDKKLYEQSTAFEATGGPRVADAIAPDGAIAVKSAWIEMDNLNPAAFYTRQALVQDPLTRQCQMATVGLVGLHIVHKTKSSPQRIWASFEHVKNAPLRGASPEAGFTFNDGGGTPMTDKPPQDWLYPFQPGSGSPAPHNVERLAPIAGHVADVNTAWHEALTDSVWKNYELVMVQWPGLAGFENRSAPEALPTPTCLGSTGTPALSSGDPAPTNLANTTLETFLQPLERRCNESATTCMACHNSARPTDYVWTIPLNATARPGSISRNRLSGLEVLRDITEGKHRAPK